MAVKTQPPAFLFPNQHFEVEFAVEGGASSSASPPSDIEVVPSLTNVCPDSLRQNCSLKLLETPRISPSRKTGVLRCCVQVPPVNRRTGLSFQIEIKVQRNVDISPCTTRTITLVNSKLKVAMTSDWEPLWYKDEGGRDKCMEGDVTLWNERDELLHENVPLKLSLCYDGEDHATVSNQEILRKVGSDTNFEIEADSGMGRIRFRVEDVSKNHQRQNFVIQISPGKGNIRDIAPAFTPAVSVRSKRNRIKTNKAKATRTSSASDSLSDANMPTPTSQQGRRTSFGDAFPAGSDPIRVRRAVQGVAQWVEETVNSLYYVRWHVIGYEHHPDGSVDYNRPLHNIQNPNPTIDRVLASYQNSVRDDLGYLQGAVEQNVARPMPAPPLAPSPYAATSMPSQPPGGMGSPPSFDRRPVPPQPYGGGYPPDFHQYGQQPPHLPPPQNQMYQPYFYQPEQRLQAIAANPSPTETSPSTGPREGAGAMDRESEVEYVLAKTYKSSSTDEKLGFPAYSAEHELLGFYRESTSKVGASQFVPVRPQDFSQTDMAGAKSILESEIAKGSDAVHALKNWGSMQRLIDHCMVYEFQKDIPDTTRGDTNR